MSAVRHSGQYTIRGSLGNVRTTTQPRSFASSSQSHSIQRMPSTVRAAVGCRVARFGQLSIAQKPVPVRDGECLDARMGVKGAEHAADVVARRLEADVELVRNLRGRMPRGEQVKDLVLPRRQV